jgi:DNA polymerase-4
MIARDVFHIRLKELELQAERIIDPGLKTCPVAIISSSHPTGTIVSLSPEAEEEGLFHGMKVSIVRKMSHGVQLLPYNQSLYARVNRYVYQSISMFTPIVEPEGVDGFYLDMSGMRAIRGHVQNTGLSIIQRIQEQTSLSGMVGISINKLVSRIVTSVVPEAIHEVQGGEEAQFLSPLKPPVLPTVQEKPVHRLLRFLCVEQVSHIQSMAGQPNEFRTFFGVHAVQLSREAKGEDSSIVKPPQLRDHILEQTVLPEDTNDENILHAMVKDLAEQVAFKLRKRYQVANKVRLELHYADGHQRGRMGRIIGIDDMSVIAVCRRLFDKANERRNRIRSILIDASEFRPYVDQANLFMTEESRNMAVSKAVEKVRLKYGVRSLQTADVFQALGRV